MEHTQKGMIRAAQTLGILTGFLASFMGSSINVALPAIAKEFNMNAVTLSWVATSFILTTAMFLVPFGKIADIYGRKKILMSGISIYTLSSFLTIFAFNSFTLILSRVVQGFGSALIFGTGMAIITSIVPPNQRGKALGYNIASVYLGLSLGPFIGGILTHNFGWRSIFLMTLPIGIAALTLIITSLKGEWAEARGEKFDFRGSVLFCIAEVAFIYGLPNIVHLYGIISLCVSLIFAVWFSIWEYKIPNPILNMNLFLKNRVFAFSNAAALINYSATFSVTFLMSLYLQYVKGMTPQKAGAILICQPIIMAVVSPFMGRLSDKVESRKLSSIGMALTVVGLAMMSRINGNTEINYIILCLGILGLGFGVFSSPNTNCIMGSVEKRFYGVASATMGTMRLTGQMFSMGMASLIISIFVGKVKITPEYFAPFIQAVRTGLLFSAGLNLIGVFASLTRGSQQMAE